MKEISKYLKRSPRVEMFSFANLYLGGEQLPARILNLSATGMAVECPVRRNRGMPVQVELFLGRSVGWIRLEARLVRDENLGQGFLWGLQFINMSEWAQGYLEGFVKDEILRQQVA